MTVAAFTAVFATVKVFGFYSTVAKGRNVHKEVLNPDCVIRTDGSVVKL